MAAQERNCVFLLEYAFIDCSHNGAEILIIHMQMKTD